MQVKALKRILEIHEENPGEEGKILTVLTLRPIREERKENIVFSRAGGRFQSQETSVTKKRDEPWFFAHV